MADFEQASTNPELGVEVQDKLDDLTSNEAKGVDLTNADNQAKEALTNNKTVVEAFGINRDKFPGEHMNAVKNVFQNICWKNFDQIEMNDIYKLTHSQKSQLAREIATLKKYPDYILPNSKIRFSDLRKYLEKQDSMIDVKSLNAAMNVNWNTKQRNFAFRYIRDRIIDNSVNEYWKMRNKLDKRPPMQDICVLAAWNLTGTTGIGWKWNIWREFFAYNLENSNQSINSLEFWPYDSPAEIWISAYWYDNAWWNLTISFGDGWSKIVWNYTKDWLNMDSNNPLPDWVTWENWVLTIPKEPYRNNPIEIKIESMKNDEIMFNFQCKNASITSWSAEIMRTPSVKEEFKPWVYELTDDKRKDFLGGINAIVKETRKTKKSDIPVVFEVWIDKTGFSDKKALDGKDVAMLENIKNKYRNNSKLIQKIQQEFDEFSNKIDLSDKFTPAQIDVQTRLAKLRFLEAMDVALTNRTFREQLEAWIININSKLVIDTRKIEAKIVSDDLNYEPQ